MTHPHLTLEGVSYVLPDGRALFTDLDETFDTRRTGLVGRNGVGKSVLARILAGELQPSTGRCRRAGSVHYLRQQVAHTGDDTVAGLAGLRLTLESLARIEAGSSLPQDFETVGDDWHARQRLSAELACQGLEHLGPETPASALSGGEAMRVALAGAWLSGADFLILDEPSNHLDRDHRQQLIEQLRQWPRGLLVVSHDRQLLDGLDRIVELSPLGLRSHGGNYSFYAESQARERQNALQQLDQRKLERRREEHAMREQRERQVRRQARGHRLGKEANQASILLDRQKERSEDSAGRLRLQQSATRQRLDQQVSDAARQLQRDAPIVLHPLPASANFRRQAVELESVQLPFVAEATRDIQLSLDGRQRVGVVGANGCGKSTLLKVMARLVRPLAGTCQVAQARAYLDQRLGQLHPDRSVLDQLRAAHPTAPEADLRMRLAQLDLDGDKILGPSAALSGGERLKAALACQLYADPPPRLLLLDEPGNHLDLPSLQALEAMLRSYQGLLVVVSHDDAFLNALELTDRLRATPQGWQLEPWGGVTT